MTEIARNSMDEEHRKAKQNCPVKRTKKEKKKSLHRE